MLRRARGMSGRMKHKQTDASRRVYVFRCSHIKRRDGTQYRRRGDAADMTIYITDIQLVLELHSSIPFAVAILLREYRSTTHTMRWKEVAPTPARPRRREADGRGWVALLKREGGILHAVYICCFLHAPWDTNDDEKCVCWKPRREESVMRELVQQKCENPHLFL